MPSAPSPLSNGGSAKSDNILYPGSNLGLHNRFNSSIALYGPMNHVMISDYQNIDKLF